MLVQFHAANCASRYSASSVFYQLLAVTLDISRIRAITLDLDDTLWPVWPTIGRAEAALQTWLAEHAPATHALHAESSVRRELREQMQRQHPEWAHDFSALRRGMIALALTRAGDDPALAGAAFEVFFAERQRVDFFSDALPALEFLSSRYPIVALSNGNADVELVGVGRYFHASVSARDVGAAKPDARIFQRGAQAAGVPPEQVLHIGDDAHLDGVGALEVGMQMAWVNREGHAWPPALHNLHTPHITVTELGALCARLGQDGP